MSIQSFAAPMLALAMLPEPIKPRATRSVFAFVSSASVRGAQGK
jgi:hypothetical protein